MKIATTWSILQHKEDKSQEFLIHQNSATGNHDLIYNIHLTTSQKSKTTLRAKALFSQSNQNKAFPPLYSHKHLFFFLKFPVA